MFDDSNDPFFTVDEAATLLRMAKRTLDNHRSQKTGPECRRHGGRIVYRRSALLAWSRKGIIRTTGLDKGRTPTLQEPRRNGGRPPGYCLAEDERPPAALE